MHVTVSTRDAAVIRTWASCLYLKNDMAQLEYFKEYLVSDPTIGVMLMQRHAIMLLGLFLFSRDDLQSRTTMDVLYFHAHDPQVLV